MLPSTVTFLTCGRWLPLFENFSTLTTFGPGIRPSRSAFSFGARRPPEDQELADVLDRRRAERLAQLAEQRLAGGAVVGEDAHLDQAVGVERGVDLAAAPPASAPSCADRDDRVEVMRLGALLLALGGGEEEGSHRAYYRRAHDDARRKSKKLNKAWLHDHLTDPYVKLAQREGYRARAAYKLKEIDEQLHLLEPGPVVVDLGAAPGAWSQYVRRKFGRGAAPTAPRPGRCTARSSPSTCSTFEPIDGVDFIRATSARPTVLAPARGARRRAAGRRRPVRHGAQSLGHRRVRRGADGATWSSWRSNSPSGHLRPDGAWSARSFTAAATASSSSASRRASDRQADQAEGVAGQVGRNLSGRNRSEAARIRRR